jgi:hypothetical protein
MMVLPERACHLAADPASEAFSLTFWWFTSPQLLRPDFQGNRAETCGPCLRHSAAWSAAGCGRAEQIVLSRQ